MEGGAGSSHCDSEMGGRAGSSHRGGEIDRGFLSNTKKTLKEIREIAEMQGCVSDFAIAPIFLRENAKKNRVPGEH